MPTFHHPTPSPSSAPSPSRGVVFQFGGGEGEPTHKLERGWLYLEPMTQHHTTFNFLCDLFFRTSMFTLRSHEASIPGPGEQTGCTCSHTEAGTHTCTFTHIFTCVHIPIHTCVHTHTYSNTHIHKDTFGKHTKLYRLPQASVRPMALRARCPQREHIYDLAPT